MMEFRPYHLTLPYQFVFDFFETRERGQDEEFEHPLWRRINAAWEAKPHKRKGLTVRIETSAEDRELQAEAEFYLTFDAEGHAPLARAGKQLLARQKRARETAAILAFGLGDCE